MRVEELWRLARGYLFSPSRGALEAAKPEAFGKNLALYLAASAASFLFWTLAPAAFRETPGPVSAGVFSLSWGPRALSGLWTAALELAGAGLTAAFALYLKSGRPPSPILRNVLCVLAAILPLVMILASYGPASSPLPALPALLLAALAAAWLFRRPAGEWKPPLGFLLGLNAAFFFLAPAVAAAFWLSSERLYQAVEIAGGIWILWATARGLGALTQLRLPRAFMSVVLALLVQVSLALALNRLGLIPATVLKAVMYE